jgi:hypothetical protein
VLVVDVVGFEDAVGVGRVVWFGVVGGVCEGVTLGVAVIVGVGCWVGLGVGVWVGVGIGEGVIVGVAVGLGVGIGVGAGDGDGVIDGAGVGESKGEGTVLKRAFTEWFLSIVIVSIFPLSLSCGFELSGKIWVLPSTSQKANR